MRNGLPGNEYSAHTHGLRHWARGEFEGKVPLRRRNTIPILRNCNFDIDCAAAQHACSVDKKRSMNPRRTD